MTTPLPSIGATGAALQPGETAEVTSGAQSPLPTPSYDFGVNVAGTAAALGLSQPRNVQDLELAYAQVASEIDATRSQNGDLTAAADLSKKASDLSVMGQTGAALNSMSPFVEDEDDLALLVSFVVYLFNAVFGMISDTAQNSGAVDITDTSTERGIETAIGRPLQTEEGLFDDQLSRDIASLDDIAVAIPENEGDATKVAERTSAFALALGAVAAGLEQVMATAVPQNAGTMGPSSQEDGRVRLAV